MLQRYPNESKSEAESSYQVYELQVRSADRYYLEFYLQFLLHARRLYWTYERIAKNKSNDKVGAKVDKVCGMLLSGWPR